MCDDRKSKGFNVKSSDFKVWLPHRLYDKANSLGFLIMLFVLVWRGGHDIGILPDDFEG